MAQFKNIKSKPKIEINLATEPKGAKKKSRAPILRPYYRPFFYIAVPINILTVLFAFFFYPYLPPVVPLFGTMRLAADRLAERDWIFLLPLLATMINSIHAAVIYFARRYDVLILKIFDFFTIFVQVLFLAVLLRTILVVI